MLYTQPTGTAANSPFVGKNVAAGIQGSKVPAAAVEAPQREIVALIAASGQSPTGTDLQQLLKGVRSGILNFYVDTGSADALIITPNPVYAAIVDGNEFVIVKGAAANATATPTLAVNGISQPLKKPDGSALAAGDLPAGAIISVRSLSGAFRVSGTRKSDIGALTSGPTFVSSIIQQIPAVAPVANVFFGAGAGSYTVPAGVYNIDVELIGGGAGGSSGTASGTYSAGGGGGSGGSARGALAVTPGQVINYVVGAGGAGAPSVNGYGSSGTSTTFGTSLTAPGAQVGTTGGYNVGSGQLGGAVGIGGYLNLKGSAGGDGAPSGAIGGNGGGTAYGTGGRAGIPNGESASAYGSGGGGAYNGGTGTTPGAGGRGADGVIIIRHN